MVLFTTTPPSDPQDPYYHCICGIHSHSFIFGLAIFEITVGFLILIAMFFIGNGHVLIAPFGLIAILLGLLLFYGNRKMKWWAYVFELCQWICSAFSNFLITGLIFFYGFAAFFVNLEHAHFKPAQETKFEQRALIGLAIILGGLLHLVLSLVFAYFTCVVVRGFQYCYKFGRTHQKLEEKQAMYY